MTRTTDDHCLAELAQLALHEQGLYEGVIDGIWGPVSDAAFAIYANYNRYSDAAKLRISLTANQQADLARFLKNWKNPASLSKYQAVAVGANLPAELVAAIHWRESGGDFSTYLQNGDPMTNTDGDPIPTTHEPAGLLFTSWITAAIEAINRETAARAASGMEEGANLVTCCIFAEYYNGEGYTERSVPDPYVLAGTSGYVAGKYTSDGAYDPACVDQQLGVLVLLRAIWPPVV